MGDKQLRKKHKDRENAGLVNIHADSDRNNDVSTAMDDGDPQTTHKKTRRGTRGGVKKQRQKAQKLLNNQKAWEARLQKLEERAAALEEKTGVTAGNGETEVDGEGDAAVVAKLQTELQEMQEQLRLAGEAAAGRVDGGMTDAQ